MLWLDWADRSSPSGQRVKPTISAHPELVEGWVEWFDKLTMSGNCYHRERILLLAQTLPLPRLTVSGLAA